MPTDCISSYVIFEGKNYSDYVSFAVKLSHNVVNGVHVNTRLNYEQSLFFPSFSRETRKRRK